MNEIERATEAFRVWCDTNHFAFEQPAESSAVYEIEGRRYVRLDRVGALTDPEIVALAVYEILGETVTRVSEWRHGFDEAWNDPKNGREVLPALLRQLSV